MFIDNTAGTHPSGELSLEDDLFAGVFPEPVPLDLLPYLRPLTQREVRHEALVLLMIWLKATYGEVEGDALGMPPHYRPRCESPEISSLFSPEYRDPETDDPYPVDSDEHNAAEISEAQAVRECMGCPMRMRCLLGPILDRSGEWTEYGIRGGRNSEERERIAARFDVFRRAAVRYVKSGEIVERIDDDVYALVDRLRIQNFIPA